jgi:hypothetical protein
MIDKAEMSTNLRLARATHEGSLLQSCDCRWTLARHSLETPNMEEIERIIAKYDAANIAGQLGTAEQLNQFALGFYKDVADIYDAVTRIRNLQRNPIGFPLEDAPILGLLVRIWKLLKEVVRYYEADNAEIISILDRPMLEAAVIATYLLNNGPAVMEDYRKCSYKDRLRILRDLKTGSAFYNTKSGQRLLKSVQEKMAFENLTEQDFQTQKANKWRLQGKSFYDIFSEVEHANLYAATYGMMSESVHGSWNESMDWCLSQNGDGTFSAFPFSHSAELRYVSPMLRFTNKPFILWLQRIDAYDANMQNVLEWIDRANTALFRKFDAVSDG